MVSDGRREGPSRGAPLILKMEELRPREGVIFPKSHSKTIAEVPQGLALCPPHTPHPPVQRFCSLTDA